jgi:hypothetical protein
MWPSYHMDTSSLRCTNECSCKTESWCCANKRTAPDCAFRLRKKRMDRGRRRHTDWCLSRTLKRSNPMNVWVRLYTWTHFRNILVTVYWFRVTLCELKFSVMSLIPIPASVSLSSSFTLKFDRFYPDMNSFSTKRVNVFKNSVSTESLSV